MRKVFADLQIGDGVEVRTSHNVPGAIHEVLTKSISPYGFKLKVQVPSNGGGGDVKVLTISAAAAKNITEAYEDEINYLWLIEQPESDESDED